MRSRFDKQLLQLSDGLTTMGSLCVKAIDEVTVSLKKQDKEMARLVMEADADIDQLEKDIEQLCLQLLLQQQPVAKDLRKISAAMKMITDMERIGDQTADIADIVLASTAAEKPDGAEADSRDTEIGAIKEKIGEMSAQVSSMVKSSVDAYVNKDLALVRKVLEWDDIVDRFFDEIRDELVRCIRREHETDGRQIFDLIMITKYLERIGDHATNVAEWVEFSITGVHRDGNKSGKPDR